MIIGNNKPNNGNYFKKENKNFLNSTLESNRFGNKIKQYEENSKKSTNIFVNDIKKQSHSDARSNNQMDDKALAMLHERLEQGVITLDEFNKKCNEIAKRRQK